MKKRILSIALTLCMVLMLAPATVFAESYGDFEYIVSGDETSGYEVTITKYTGSGSDVVIPSKIDEKDVTSIENHAFFECTSLTSVTIPESVTSIGGAAFYNCTSLTSVNIPNGVTSIGERTFYNCTSLTSVNIPKSVTSIGGSAFLGCTSLTSITVDKDNSNYSSVEGVLFNKEQTKLIIYPSRKIGTSYDISNIVTSIENNAFYGCTNLESVTIPVGVTSIPLGIFENCTSLKSVTIPEGVTSIELDAFGNCTSLESVTIPESVTSIGGAAFENCTSLESVTIPDSVTSIGAEAFYNCTNLKNVTIPEGVTYIGSFAFYKCKNLKSVIIPKGVTSIGMYTFNNCTSLESITFEDYSQLISIGDTAFTGCTSLKRVILPNGVTNILDSAFSDCTSLESVEVPSSVSFTEWGVFYGCTSLESIFLPDNLDASDAEIPNKTSQVRYSLDETKGEITIIKIELGTGKTGVAIPATICGYPVVAISDESLLKMISSHTCVGGEATCQTRAICAICKQEYGNTLPEIIEGTGQSITAGEKKELTFKITVPQTGDNSHMALWMAVLLVSGGLLTVTVIKGVETEQKRRK